MISLQCQTRSLKRGFGVKPDSVLICGNLYSTGAAYARSSVEILLDHIRFLYGDAVSGRVRVLLSREITCESTWADVGLCLNLYSQNPMDCSQQN
jgi:hypothetical protein